MVLHHNGAKLWFRMAGPAHSAPVVYFLHGGPGYSSYSFEHSIGPRLETRVLMVYHDQRDCGRSHLSEGDAPVGIEAMVDDLERLRQELGHQKITLLGHSFGGLLALEYLRRHSQNVQKLILVDVTANLRATIRYQLDYIRELASRVFPEHAAQVEALAQGALSPVEKLAAVYRVFDWVKLQRELFWHRTEGLYLNMSLDIRADDLERRESRLVPALKNSGYLESEHRELLQKIAIPGILIAGRHSHAMGEGNLRQAASAWGLPLVWFESSGHCPYIEEPDLFAQTVFGLTAAIHPRNNFDHEEAPKKRQ